MLKVSTLIKYKVYFYLFARVPLRNVITGRIKQCDTVYEEGHQHCEVDNYYCIIEKLYVGKTKANAFSLFSLSNDRSVVMSTTLKIAIVFFVTFVTLCVCDEHRVFYAIADSDDRVSIQPTENGRFIGKISYTGRVNATG